MDNNKSPGVNPPGAPAGVEPADRTVAEVSRNLRNWLLCGDAVVPAPLVRLSAEEVAAARERTRRATSGQARGAALGCGVNMAEAAVYKEVPCCGGTGWACPICGGCGNAPIYMRMRIPTAEERAAGAASEAASNAWFAARRDVQKRLRWAAADLGDLRGVPDWAGPLRAWRDWHAHVLARVARLANESW